MSLPALLKPGALRSATSGQRGPDLQVGHSYPTTSIPIERAVPATVLIAASSDPALRSGCFSLAMSSTYLRVTVPTFALFGSAEPFARFAARLSSTDAGGVFVMNV